VIAVKAATVVLILLLPAAAAGPEEEIRKVLERQQADWNRGDIVAFMGGYERSDATTFAGKSVSRGYERVLGRYRESYPNTEKMGQLTFSEIEVRLLGSKYASVLGQYALKRSKEGGGEAQGRFTLIFRKTRAGWKIIHDHTS
jgi:uncharacterized protein (TIGR02246 family)